MQVDLLSPLAAALLSLSAASPRPFGPADFAPYFAEGNLKAAKAELDRGRYRAALRLLESEGDSHPVAYLRALAALRGGELKRAAERFDALARSYAPMADHCRYHAARAYERLGRFAEAADRFRAVSADSSLREPSRLGLARALSKLGRHREALAELEPLAKEGEHRAEALHLLALAARRAKDRKVEREALLSLWSDFPRSSVARAARSQLSDIPLEAQVARAEALLELHRNREAIRLLQPHLKKLELPHPLACRARYAVGRALRKERRHSQAIEMLSGVTERCTDEELKVKALYTLGYSQSVVAPEAAVGTYRRLAAEFPTHSFADDALFFAAETLARLGDGEAASELHDELFRRRWTDEYAFEARFHAFWMSREAGRLEEALGQLDELEALAGYALSDERVQRARYWKGRTLEQLGRTPEATEAFASLVEHQPAGYYPVLARERLRALGSPVATVPSLPPAGEALSWPVDTGPLLDEPHFLTGIELMRLDLPGAANELLAIDRSALPPDSLRLLFQICYAKDLPGPARAFARAYFQWADPRDSRTRPVWEVMYPRHFRDVIEANAARAGVDPDLLQALVRAESGFWPRARSATGAIGLTQLMPRTARSVARSLKMRPPSEWGLMNPHRNVLLGASYLASLIDQFDGKWVLAVAAYNAGPQAVRRWLAARPDMPLDELVEEIPIEETRGYVKRVIGGYDVYAQLWPKESPVPVVTAGR